MNLAVNPVLRRELVERMRSRRSFVVLTLYLAVLAGILYLVYRANRGSTADAFGEASATEVASVGRSIFEWLLFFMVLLVLFLVPGQTAGAIAGERERQTLVPLQVTLLRPISLLLGKIGASLAFLLLLVVATLPLLSVGYLIGGVSVAQVVAGVAMVVFAGVVLACLSAAISAFARRVQAATVLSYGVTLLLTIGTLLAWAAAGVVDTSRGIDDANPPEWILLPNPIVALADVVGGDEDALGTTSSPFDPMDELLRRDDEDAVIMPGDGPDIVRRQVIMDDEDGAVIQAEAGAEFAVIGEDRPGDDPFWPVSCGLLGALAVLAVVLAARRLRTPAATER